LVRSKIKKTNEAHQAQASKHKNKMVFQPGDVVWIHLRKEDFHPKGRTSSYQGLTVLLRYLNVLMIMLTGIIYQVTMEFQPHSM